MSNTMNFEDALRLMKEGYRLTRESWKDMNVMAMLDETSMGRVDFQKVVRCQVAHHTYTKLGWDPTRNDILANDWMIV